MWQIVDNYGQVVVVIKFTDKSLSECDLSVMFKKRFDFLFFFK